MNPNIIVIGVPRSGTSITSSMLRTLGWNYTSDSNWGAESKAVREIHNRMVSDDKRCFLPERFDEKAARDALRDVKPPWVIKDPAWSFTLPVWEPLLREACGERHLVMIWPTRDIAEVEMSWRRRTDRPVGGAYIRSDGTVAGKDVDITILEWLAQAERTFANWDGVKVRVDLADLKKAAALFDITPYRIVKRRFREWRGLTLRRMKKYISGNSR